MHEKSKPSAVREQQVNKKLKLVNIHKPLIYIEILRVVRLIQKYPFEEAIPLSWRNNLSLHFPFSKFHCLV